MMFTVYCATAANTHTPSLNCNGYSTLWGFVLIIKLWTTTIMTINCSSWPRVDRSRRCHCLPAPEANKVREKLHRKHTHTHTHTFVSFRRVCVCPRRKMCKVGWGGRGERTGKRVGRRWRWRWRGAAAAAALTMIIKLLDAKQRNCY